MYFSFILGWFPANARTRWNKSIFLGVAIDHWFILEWHTFQPTLIEESLEVKLPTIWTDGNTEVRRNIEEKKKKEDQRRERVRGKKMQVREKVQKSQFTMFFQWFVAPEGRKSRLAKAAGAEPSGQMRNEKLHAVVARSTFGSQNAHNTSCSDHFWKLRRRKSARRCGAKHISKSTVLKADGFGALLDVQMSFSVAVARDCAPCQKRAKREGFVAVSKNHGRRGAFEEDLQRCIFCGPGSSTKDMFMRDVRRSGRWCPWEGLHFGASDLSGLLRWFCVTGAALRMTWPHFFVAGAVL